MTNRNFENIEKPNQIFAYGMPAKNGVDLPNINYGEILKISSNLDVMSSGYSVAPETVNNIINQIENLFLSASESSFGYTQQNENSSPNNHKIKKY